MKEKRCELVRRELDELMLGEECSTAVNEHLQACAECREFQRQQTRLRQIVGSLGTVNAPADFDFRLRARLAADSQRTSFQYWSFAAKALATAAVLLLFGVAAFFVWQRAPQPQFDQLASHNPEPSKPGQQPRPESKPIDNSEKQVAPVVAVNPPARRNVERPPQSVFKPKRQLVSTDFSSERANVVSNLRPAIDNTTAAVFPIEASLQSLKVSLDDGRGNARTISVPAVSFGSQRVLATGNQFAPKRDW